jgi:hypothetical protein
MGAWRESALLIFHQCAFLPSRPTTLSCAWSSFGPMGYEGANAPLTGVIQVYPVTALAEGTRCFPRPAARGIRVHR